MSGLEVFLYCHIAEKRLPPLRMLHGKDKGHKSLKTGSYKFKKGRPTYSASIRNRRTLLSTTDHRNRAEAGMDSGGFTPVWAGIFVWCRISKYKSRRRAGALHERPKCT